MSYATQIFVYTQRQIVLLQSGFSGRIYLPPYSKPLTLNKGVDNQIIFQFLDNQQKPIDITGLSITCRIISYDGNAVLVTSTLNPGLTVNGFATLDLGAADIEDIDAQRAYYSLAIPSGNLTYPVFVDQNAGARGEMNIVNSILPAFVPSAYVTIPTGQPFPNISNSSPANANTYYSSVISTDNNPVLTLQATYDQYVGNVVIQGSCQVNTDWYPIITSNTYSNVSDTYYYVIKGYHPYIQMAFTSNAGGVTNIISR